MELLKRQIRRVIVPSGRLLAAVVQQAPLEFKNAKVLEIQADVTTGQVILHVETQTDQILGEDGHPVPLDFPADWEAVFWSGEDVDSFNALRTSFENFAIAVLHGDKDAEELREWAKKELADMPSALA